MAIVRAKLLALRPALQPGHLKPHILLALSSRKAAIVGEDVAVVELDCKERVGFRVVHHDYAHIQVWLEDDRRSVKRPVTYDRLLSRSERHCALALQVCYK